MKIVLETIPVWDALKENAECPMCSLMKRAESDALSYYMSSSVMTPEVRVETNRYGFCHHHLKMMAEMNKPQVLALVMDTYYEESSKLYEPDLDRIASAKNLKATKKAIEQFRNDRDYRDRGCLVCTRMEDRLYRYSYTIAALFKEDYDFKKYLSISKGFCIEHTLKLSEVAEDALKGADLEEYLKCIFSLLQKSLKRVQHDDWWMTQMYKSENRGKDWAGCEDAHKRAVMKLIGEGIIWDSIKDKKSKI